MAEDRMLSDEILLGLINKNSGGGGGTSDYSQLTNKPQINGNTLTGDQSASDLGLVAAETGKGLSTNDYTDADKAIVGGVTAALAGKQATLTFDDAPTANSSNPVKSGGIYDALALKQDATDNNLTTTDKTIVGAINEHEGDIDSLKSGLTNLDNEVNGDATTYDFADVVTIENAIPANVADCNVKIEPVQDLHGYDHPWVGGTGKNKYSVLVGEDTWYNNNASHSNDNGTLVITFDANVSTPGVYTPSSGSVLRGLINGKSTDIVVSFNAYATTQNFFVLGNANNPKTVTFKTSKERFYVTFSANYSSNFVIYQKDDNKIANTVYISDLQVEEGSTMTDYAPYTNICPISGHTEASVQRDGKNELPLPIAETKNGVTLVRNADGSVTLTGTNGSGATYFDFFSGNFNSTKYAGYLLRMNTAFDMGASSITCRISNSSRNDLQSVNENTDLAIADNGDGLYLALRIQGGYALPQGGVTIYPMLRRPTDSADFEPYAGKTYTIALGDTIYGGTVDFNTGVMTVTVVKETFTWGNYHSTVDLTNTVRRQFNLANTAEYPTDISGKCNVAEYFVSFTNDSVHFYTNNDILNLFLPKGTPDDTAIEVTYPLATPTTIQLTPQQIQLLKGVNTLTASTGDISVTVNGVSGSIGAVQTQANNTDEALAELADKLPTAPTTDGAYVLTVTVADGIPTYSWESAE